MRLEFRTPGRIFERVAVGVAARIGLAVVLVALLAAGCSDDQEPVEPEPIPESTELVFPFADPSVVVEVHNFALHPWSDSGETHSGIDLVPTYRDLAGTNDTRTVAIVAPAGGTIAMFDEGSSGAGLQSFVVVIQVDTYWHLLLVFEPQSEDAGTNAAQQASFEVAAGDTVSTGQKIADLVISKVASERYPHLHFGVFYKDPNEPWDDVYATLRVSDGATASPPIANENLGTLTTFYCPYDYFLAAGQAVVDALPRLDLAGNECSCACSYGSFEGNCGVCLPAVPPGGSARFEPLRSRR